MYLKCSLLAPLTYLINFFWHHMNVGFVRSAQVIFIVTENHLHWLTTFTPFFTFLAALLLLYDVTSKTSFDNIQVGCFLCPWLSLNVIFTLIIIVCCSISTNPSCRGPEGRFGFNLMRRLPAATSSTRASAALKEMYIAGKCGCPQAVTHANEH